MENVLFMKLGGSLITDKTAVEVIRLNDLSRIAEEIRQALKSRPKLQLVLGHGSGSFGHVAAARHGTRQGVQGQVGWFGFAEVSDTAARLNRIVCKALLDAGVSAVTLQPSASAYCTDGQISTLTTEPVEAALAAGLVPVLYGDVAFDRSRGGTIISSEEIMSYLARRLKPSWFLLAGETGGVLDQDGQIIPSITKVNFNKYQSALGGSRGTDVTGGMDSKVRVMLDLVSAVPDLSIRIFSGLVKGEIERQLISPSEGSGTIIQAS